MTPALEGATGRGASAPLASWCFLLLLLFAACIRLSNLGYDSLSHDECWRVNNVHHGSWQLLRWFPPGQLAVFALGQYLFPRTEFWIRLPDALLGIGAVALIYFVTRPKIGCWAALGAAAFVAVHPQTVLYSRVLKELSFETVLTLVLLFTGCRAATRFTRQRVWAFYASAVLGLLFGFVPIVVATAWGPFVLYTACRDRGARRANFILLCKLTAGMIPLVAAWYVWVVGSPLRQVAQAYYTSTAQSWLLSYTPDAIIEWFVKHLKGALLFVTGTSTLWQPRAASVLTCVSIVALVGLGELWQRWPLFVKYMCALFVLAVIMALTRHWPLGDYHTVLYLVPLFAIFIGCGLDRLIRGLRLRLIGATLAFACLAYPGARAVRDTVIQPTESEHVRPLIAEMREHLRPDDALFVYYPVDCAMEFYWPDPEVRTLIQPRERGRFDRFKERFDELARDHPRVWFLFTHRWGNEREEWTGYALDRYPVVYRFGSDETFAYCFDTSGAFVSSDRAAGGAATASFTTDGHEPTGDERQ